MHYGDPKDFEWDVVTGVSIGGANSFIVSLYPKGKELEMVDYITKFWSEAHTKDSVWRHHWGGVAQGFAFEEGILDDTPMYNRMVEISKEFVETGF